MREKIRLVLPAAVVVAVIFGIDKVWTDQIGAWAAGVRPLFSSIAVEFFLYAAVSAVAVAVLKRLKVRDPALWIAWLIFTVSQALCVCYAWGSIAGRMGQGIDHPAFLFRLHEFFEVFPPAVGSYNPWWNGGTEHFIGVTSGVHGFGILMAPFMLFMEFETAYSAALLFWMAVGFPCLTALVFRRAGMRPAAALAGGIAMLAFTRAEFLFFWQSGNLGGMVTAMLTPSLVAVGHRIAVQRRGTVADVVMLALFAWLSCIWAPGYCTCGGLFIGWLLIWKRWTKKSVCQILAAGIAALLLLSPWIWAAFFPARGIAEYVATEGAPLESIWQMFRTGLFHYFKRLREWHPFISVFGIGGLLLLPGRNTRRWMVPVFAVLSAVALVIGFRRTSQLDRVAIQAAGAMAFPAAVMAGRYLSWRQGGTLLRKCATAARCCVVLAVLALGGRVASAHFANSAGFKFWPANDALYGYADWIKENVPRGGRFAFAGLTDCKFEWGKPSYLPILCGREMMSDDYYGYPKGLTERNYPPKFYRKSTESFIFFSDAYGITHWAVTDSRSKRFFDSNPDLFELADYRMLQSTHVYTYRRKGPEKAGPVLLGEAEVAARENSITVTPSAACLDGMIVIRYNWRRGLRCRTEGAEIFPHKVDENITFIGVRPSGRGEVRIGYSPSWAPLQPNFDGTFHH